MQVLEKVKACLQGTTNKTVKFCPSTEFNEVLPGT